MSERDSRNYPMSIVVIVMVIKLLTFWTSIPGTDLLQILCGCFLGGTPTMLIPIRLLPLFLWNLIWVIMSCPSDCPYRIYLTDIKTII